MKEDEKNIVPHEIAETVPGETTTGEGTPTYPIAVEDLPSSRRNSRRNLGIGIMTGSLGVILYLGEVQANVLKPAWYTVTPAPTRRHKSPTPSQPSPTDTSVKQDTKTSVPSNTPEVPTATNTPVKTSPTATKGPDTATPGHDKVTATPTRKIPHYPPNLTSTPTDTPEVPTATKVASTATGTGTPEDTATATHGASQPPPNNGSTDTATATSSPELGAPGSDTTPVINTALTPEMPTTPIIPKMPQTGGPSNPAQYLGINMSTAEVYGAAVVAIVAGTLIRDIHSTEPITRRSLITARRFLSRLRNT